MNTKQNAFFEYKRDIDETPALSPPNSLHNIEAHFHKQFEIFYVTRGQARVTVNGEERILCADQLALCDSFDVHSLLTPTENDLSISVIVPFYLMTDYRNKKGDCKLAENFVLDRESAIRFKAIIDTLGLFLKKDADPVSADLMRALLSLAAQTVGFADKKDHTTHSLGSDVLQYISEHCTEELTLERVAKRFGYSPYYFSKLFVSTFRTSFGVYLNTLRLKQALWLIKTEAASVLDAALRSGFNSEATFYRFVRDQFGTTPKGLLKAIQEENMQI